MSAGAGGIYGKGPGKGGLNLRGYYNIGAQKLCFGPEFSIFQKSSAHGRSLRTIELGLIGHYIFHLSPNSGFYPLTGPNLSIERIGGNKSDPHTERIWGWNAGAGIHLAYGNWAPFAEWKYIFGKAEQQAFAIGLICNFR